MEDTKKTKKAAAPKGDKPAPLSKEEKAKAREEAKAKKAADGGASRKLHVVDGKGGKKQETLNGAVEPYIEVATEHLLCKLTAQEEVEKLRELSTTMKDINKLKAQGKAAAAEYNSQATERSGHLKTIQNQLDEGISRPVKCEVKYDFKGKVVTRTRLDTGEVIGTRPMNDYDRSKAQESLPFAKQQEAAEAVQAGALTPDGEAAVAGAETATSPAGSGPGED